MTRERARLAACQQTIGQVLDLASQLLERLPERIEDRFVARCCDQQLEVEPAREQVISHFQNLDEHASPTLSTRRAR